MNIKLVLAIVSITLALLFYTIGVFTVRRTHTIKKSHVLLFWMGLLCDTTGTITMTTLAKGSQTATNAINIHGITGVIAILLMLVNAIWATAVLVKNDTFKQETFQKFNILIWLVWLVPYILGMVMGMGK